MEGPPGNLGPGHFVGGATISAYADLQNGITINPSQTYGIGVSILVPSNGPGPFGVPLPVNAQIGVGFVNGKATTGMGEITLFYDIETVAVGK